MSSEEIQDVVTEAIAEKAGVKGSSKAKKTKRVPGAGTPDETLSTQQQPKGQKPSKGGKGAKDEKAGKEGKKSPRTGPPTLELVKEARLADLLVEVMDGQYEASGVHQHDGRLYIVFDNYPNIACLTADLTAPPESSVLIRQRGERIGYEDITFQSFQRRWYCLIEATEYEPDLYHSRIEEYDETFRFIESVELNFKIKGSNKGIEGLSRMRYKDEDYLLALCEGNACKSGAAGREGGKGRILLFQRGIRRWEHVGTAKLPKSVDFIDYSSLDLWDRWIAVVSQESSAVWIARMKPDPAGLDDLWEDEGRVYVFPRDKKGRPLYCNIEGITWLSETQIAVVSDKAKAGKQPAHCVDRDQAVHIFNIPAV
jgi:hypothetical protein